MKERVTQKSKECSARRVNRPKSTMRDVLFREKTGLEENATVMEKTQERRRDTIEWNEGCPVQRSVFSCSGLNVF